MPHAVETPGDARAAASDRGDRHAILTGLSILLLVGAVFLAGTMAVVMVFIRARFVRIFEDFDTELPGLTKVFVAIPDLVVVFLALLGIAALIVKEVFCRKPIVNMVINLAVGIALFAGWGVVVIALFMPLVKLIQSVEG